MSSDPTPTNAVPFEPDPVSRALYPEVAVGGFSRVNGDIAFYTRINALVGADSRVLDFGAGRGWWATEPFVAMSRQLRRLRGRVAEVVGTDVDPAVLDNPTLDRAVVVKPGEQLPLDDGSFDLVYADYVLEHVDAADAAAVAADIMRVLRPGGWFCARTPNKWGMIGIGARVIPNSLHVRLLRVLQPDRKAEDVFPVRYAMNTPRALRRAFRPHRVHVWTQASEPAYFGRSRLAWRCAQAITWLTPPPWGPTLLVFVQKADDES